MVLCSVLNAVYVQPRPQAFPLENRRGRCYSDMGIPSSYYLRVRVRFTGLGLQEMPISLGFWEWGCPYHCDSALLFAIEKALDTRFNI